MGLMVGNSVTHDFCESHPNYWYFLKGGNAKQLEGINTERAKGMNGVDE